MSQPSLGEEEQLEELQAGETIVLEGGLEIKQVIKLRFLEKLFRFHIA